MPTPYAPSTVAELATRLERQRAKAQALLVALREEADTARDALDVSDVFDDHSPGTGDVVAERERARLLALRAARDIADIELALARIELGTYGTCERCSDRIPVARLRALPQTTLCLPCSASRGFPVRRRARTLAHAAR